MIAVGEGVTSVNVGDRVILPWTVRKWQQRVLVSAEDLIVAPPDADPQQAAMMAINAATAALLLDQYVDLQPGDAVAYNAATSGLAQWLVALAECRGSALPARSSRSPGASGSPSDDSGRPHLPDQDRANVMLSSITAFRTDRDLVQARQVQAAKVVLSPRALRRKSCGT